MRESMKKIKMSHDSQIAASWFFCGAAFIMATMFFLMFVFRI